MENAWRIGLFLGLAILGGRRAAEAQTPPAVGAADRPRPAADTADRPRPVPPPAAPATATAGPRRRTEPYFNRVVTTGRGPAASGPMGQGDPLRPYSAGAGQAHAQGAMGSTRARPRVVSPPRAAPSSHNYYPGMRASRHPNANAARVRHPQRGMGMGKGMGAPPSTPGAVGIPAGGAGRGR